MSEAKPTIEVGGTEIPDFTFGDLGMVRQIVLGLERGDAYPEEIQRVLDEIIQYSVVVTREDGRVSEVWHTIRTRCQNNAHEHDYARDVVIRNQIDANGFTRWRYEVKFVPSGSGVFVLEDPETRTMLFDADIGGFFRTSPAGVLNMCVNDQMCDDRYRTTTPITHVASPDYL